MKVREANNRLEQLKRLSNNIKLLYQYFSNEKELDEEIAEATGMNSSVNNTIRNALDEISTMATKYEQAILDAEIVDINIK